MKIYLSKWYRSGDKNNCIIKPPYTCKFTLSSSFTAPGRVQLEFSVL
jgi:hypothetical protein